MKTTLLFIISLIVISSCTKLSKYDKKRVNSAIKDTLTSKTESWNVHMDLVEGGHKRVVLNAPYAATYQKDNGSQTHFKGPVKIAIQDTLGNITTTVRCNKALFNSDNSVFEFSGDVVVKTDKKKILRSEYLKWIQKSHNIETPNYVVITTPSDSIAGYGLKGKEDLSTYTINKVKGRVSVK